MGSLDKSQNYYLYCRSGARSGAATQFLKSNGFTNAFNVGGFGSIAHLV
jgi:rhodanese-related sulfurtransferase